jgi:hypothetical protein
LYPHFGEREHPNLDHWHGKGGFVDPKEGFDFNQILSEPPARHLDGLRKATDHSWRRDRLSYLSNLVLLFPKNREWGKGFMDALARDADFDEDIWREVFSAWRNTIKSSEDWEWILNVIEDLPGNRAVFAGVANLVSNGVWRQEPKLSDPLITKAVAVMDKAWELCSKNEEAPDDSFREWLDVAINHEGGWIGEFWIHYCSHLRQRAGGRWKGIPPTLKSKMQDALNGISRVRVYARIAMTPWMDFIFAWDRKFAEQNFLPLLDWQRNPIVAQQTWSVLLNYRRTLSLEMEAQLLPYYRQVANRMIGMLKDTTEKTGQFDEPVLHNLGLYLAGLATRIIPNPVESRFFREFLPLLPERVRASLAIGMGNFLASTPPDKGRKIWNLWLREYLDLRLVGVPVALSTEETKAMAEWCLHLGSVFQEAVRRVVQMPMKNISAYGIIDKLQSNPLLEKFPKESCGYLVAVLRGEDYPYLHPSLPLIHGKLKKTVSGTSEFRDFEELLYLRGWKNTPQQ